MDNGRWRMTGYGCWWMAGFAWSVGWSVGLTASYDYECTTMLGLLVYADCMQPVHIV